jgi:cytochrome c5
MPPASRAWLTIALLAVAGGRADAAAERGERVYAQSCAVCHGADAAGAMPGVPDLGARQGALTKSDSQLLRSLVNGVQSPGAPLAMPPRGGNPALTDDDLRSALDYLRGLTGVRSGERKPVGETRP